MQNCSVDVATTTPVLCKSAGLAHRSCQSPGLRGGAGETFLSVDDTQKVRKKEEKRKEERKKKSEKREGKEGFRSIREFINYSKYLYYVGSRRVLSDLLDFNGVVRNEDRIIGT